MEAQLFLWKNIVKSFSTLKLRGSSVPNDVGGCLISHCMGLGKVSNASLLLLHLSSNLCINCFNNNNNYYYYCYYFSNIYYRHLLSLPSRSLFWPVRPLVPCDIQVLLRKKHLAASHQHRMLSRANRVSQLSRHSSHNHLNPMLV